MFNILVSVLCIYQLTSVSIVRVAHRLSALALCVEVFTSMAVRGRGICINHQGVCNATLVGMHIGPNTRSRHVHADCICSAGWDNVVVMCA